MDPKQRGEIALKVLKWMMRKRGIALSQSTMRDVGNIAKDIKVPIEELKEFVRPLMQELLDECFAAKQQPEN